MIESSLIDSARIIKNQSNSLNETLSIYENDVKELAAYFFKISDELKNIESEIGSSDGIDKIRDKVMSKFGDLELEAKKVSDKVNDINIKLEKLRKDENDLYLIIKKRHPSLSDKEIVSEIQSRINE